jgi:hypothetical protein
MPSLDSKVMSTGVMSTGVMFTLRGWMEVVWLAGWTSSSSSRDGKKFVGKSLMVCIVGRYNY